MRLSGCIGNNKNLITLLVVLACLIIPINGFCAEPKAQTDETVVLNFWELSVGEELMRSLLDKFEKENPGIKVKLQQLSWDYGFDKIILSIAAGNAPDVCELGTDWVPKFSSSDVLLDITDDVQDIKDQYMLWEPTYYEGRIYGAPWLAGTRVMFYNRDLFFKAGLNPDKPPTTWNELLECAKAIDRLAPDIYGFGIFAAEPYAPWQEFLPFAWGNGGRVLSKDLTKVEINSPEVAEALEFYSDLKQYSIVDRQPQINTMFAQEKVGIQMSGFWNFKLIPRFNPKLNFGVALLPKPSKRKGFPAAFAGGEIFVILKDSPHAKEALKLIKFLIKEENTLEIVKVQHNVVPTSRASLDNPYYKAHPDEKIFFQQMLTAVAPPNHPNWVSIQEEITRVIEDVVIGNVPVKHALIDAEARIDAILKQEQVRGRLSDRLITTIILIMAAVLIISVLIVRKIKKKKSAMAFSLKRDYTTLIFLSPWVLTFLVFGIYPLVYSVIISLCKYNLLNSQLSFAGLDNFLNVVRDPVFRKAVGNTVIFAFGTIPFTMVVALFCAVLINQKIPFKQLYQAGLFIPVSTSVIVIATIFTFMYSPGGLLNSVLAFLKLPYPNPSWLMNEKWALPSIMFMNIWASFGYYMVLFLAGLQTIPASLYEAASIDGANDWQKFRHITLPQLRPILLFAMVINTIRTFQVFPEIFTMTRGGPRDATTTVVYYLYDKGFHKFQMGEAAAVAYLLFFIILGFSLVQMKFFNMGENVAE